MQNFYSYLTDQSLANDKERLAKLMVRHNVDPYLHIEHFLHSNSPLLTEWLDSFFKRIGNAWDSFMKNPNEKPTSQLEIARQAMNDLHQTVASSQNSFDMQMVLRGLEQSLNILEKIKPTLQRYDQILTGKAPHSVDDSQLPQEWHTKWISLVQRQHEFMKEPNSEEKKNKLIALDDEFEIFWKQLQDYYQSIPDRDPSRQNEKERVKNFLQSVDTDTAFRDIRDLLDMARKRTQENLAIHRPETYKQVAATWQQIVKKTTDPSQRSKMLLQWYQQLPNNHELKIFIHKDMEENPEVGNNEANVFWKYAVEWINKFPHHMSAGSQ